MVRLTYRSQAAAAPAARDVHPYNLISHKGSLYLFAFAPEYDEVRSYKLDRMEKVATTAKRFARPLDFDVAKCLEGSFGIYDGDENVALVVKVFPAAVPTFRESKVRPRCEMVMPWDGRLHARFARNAIACPVALDQYSLHARFAPPTNIGARAKNLPAEDRPARGISKVWTHTVSARKTRNGVSTPADDLPGRTFFARLSSAEPRARGNHWGLYTGSCTVIR